MTPEPKGKLDTMNGSHDALASAPPAVNGPEGDPPGWDSVDWGQAEQNVRRLRQRIFAASQAGDLKKVRNLQKLMLRSRANALVSVRRVTEVNAGRKLEATARPVAGNGRLPTGACRRANTGEEQCNAAHQARDDSTTNTRRCTRHPTKRRTF